MESNAVEKHSVRRITQLDDVHAIQHLYERAKSKGPSKGSRWRYMGAMNWTLSSAMDHELA